MFTVNLDSNDFVLSISHTKNDNIEIDLDKIDLKYLNAYQLSGKTLVLNQDRKNEIIAEELKADKEREIASLKRFLADSDYIIAETFENVLALDNPVTFISDFIKIMVQFNSKYADLIANRKIWRDRIEELSK